MHSEELIALINILLGVDLFLSLESLFLNILFPKNYFEIYNYIFERNVFLCAGMTDTVFGRIDDLTNPIENSTQSSR